MKTKLKVMTYNIYGLPDELDLNTLPWILKPISWIYWLLKGTTIIQIKGEGSDTSKNTEEISKYLSESEADLIGVQEDFNYHEELISHLPEYSYGTVQDKFNFDNLFKKIEFWSYFPLPRFKMDGINILTRCLLSSEKIIPWKKSYGYFSHANDLLTHKGFRTYTITVEGEYDVDVYIIHMDADFYDPGNCKDVSKDVETRRSQLDQLLTYISNRSNNNPIIIMGDTNSYDKYLWDVKNIEYFVNSFNYIPELECKEAIPNNYSDCDRIFYINNSNSIYKLELENCYYDLGCEYFSDHLPLIANFNITE